MARALVFPHIHMVAGEYNITFSNGWLARHSCICVHISIFFLRLSNGTASSPPPPPSPSYVVSPPPPSYVDVVPQSNIAHRHAPNCEQRPKGPSLAQNLIFSDCTNVECVVWLVLGWFSGGWGCSVFAGLVPPYDDVITSNYPDVIVFVSRQPRRARHHIRAHMCCVYVVRLGRSHRAADAPPNLDVDGPCCRRCVRRRTYGIKLTSPGDQRVELKSSYHFEIIVCALCDGNGHIAPH